MEKINKFRGENLFLSNFYMASVKYDGITFTNSEAAFQAQKCKDPADRALFMDLSPSEAKKKGRHIELRSDWEDVKVDIMRDIVMAKFEQHIELKTALIATGNIFLEEGNNWGDTTWGTVNGIGKNLLGNILMDTRKRLREQAEDKELLVLERENGWYGGYIMKEGRYEQTFNTSIGQLFMSIKWYTDNDYRVQCLEKKYEPVFMKNWNTVNSKLGISL